MSSLLCLWVSLALWFRFTIKKHSVITEIRHSSWPNGRFSSVYLGQCGMLCLSNCLSDTLSKPVLPREICAHLITSHVHWIGKYIRLDSQYFQNDLFCKQRFLSRSLVYFASPGVINTVYYYELINSFFFSCSSVSTNLIALSFLAPPCSFSFLLCRK